MRQRLTANVAASRAARQTSRFGHYTVKETFYAARASATALTRFYPLNRGFAGATERRFLTRGELVDRYGGSGYSRFFSPAGTPDWARALPPGTIGQRLSRFEVLKPFEVEAGEIAPAFGQLGGGLQFYSSLKLEILLRRGILKEVY